MEGTEKVFTDAEKLALANALKLVALSEALLCCNLVRIDNICKTVRIEFGKVGKEGLSKIVPHDGTLDGLLAALQEAQLSTDYKGNR